MLGPGFWRWQQYKVLPALSLPLHRCAYSRCSSDYSLCPQNYDHPSPQYGRIDCGPPYSPTLSLSLSPYATFSSPLYSPTTDASSLSSPPAFAPSPSSPTTFALPSSTSPARVLVEAPCAEGIPIRQGGGYTCSICNEPFKRRDDAKRHIKSAGMRVSCKYCGKPGSRRDSRARHLKSGTCQKAWEAGYKAGRFTDWSVEDAYN